MLQSEEDIFDTIKYTYLINITRRDDSAISMCLLFLEQLDLRDYKMWST